MTVATGPTRANPQPLHPAAPVPALGEQYKMLAADGTQLDASVLPAASGTWLTTEILDVTGWDEAWVLAQYDAHASTTTGAAWLLARAASTPQLTTPQQTSPPVVTDDVWGYLPCLDGSLTATAPGGTMAGGSAETGSTVAGLQKVYGELVQVPGGGVAANSAKARVWVRFKVRGVRWLMFEAAEGVDATNRGKLRLYVLGVV